MKKKRFSIVFFGRKIGFTLTELLIVVVIIGVIAVLALPMLVKTIEKAKVGEAMSNLNLIRTGQKIYFLEYGGFSPDIDSLNIEDPNNPSSRYFSYSIDALADPTDDFTARAARGAGGAQPASSPYDDDEYTITKDGAVTGPLL